MRIWIDADACPRPVREIVLRAANRLNLEVILVADKPIPVTESARVRCVRVDRGVDAADAYVVESIEEGDLVITADIPLAGAVVRKEATAIDFRGDLYDRNTIGDRLPFRNLMMGLRDTGAIEGGGPAPFGPTDRRKFAATFDAFLTRALRQPGKMPEES